MKLPSIESPPTTPLLPLRDSAITWIVYVLLVIALSAIYFADLRHHLMGLDDGRMFADNLSFDKDFSTFFNPAEERSLASGRPFSEFVKFVVYKIWGNDVATYHLFTIGLHVACSFLLAFLARRLGLFLDLSLLIGLLFLVNVAHFGAVHWISALDYPLATLWGMLAAICYVHNAHGAGKWWLCAFHVAFLLGLLSHISIVFVALFCLYWSWRFDQDITASVQRLLPAIISTAIALAVAAYTTADTTTSGSALERIESSSSFIVELASAALWMNGRVLSTAHWLPIRLHQEYDWELAIGGISFFAMAFFIWRRHYPVDLWSAWTVFALLPFLPAAVVHTGISRYVYMATIGSSGIIAWLLYRCCALIVLKKRMVGYAAMLVSVMALMCSSYIALKRAEYVSIYASAKHYLSINDVDTGARLMRTAITAGPETVNLIAAHTSLLQSLIGNNMPFEEDLKKAQSDLPDDINILAMSTAYGLLSDDPVVTAQSSNTLQYLSVSTETDNREVLWHVMKVTLRNLGHRANRDRNYALAVRAYQQALHFDPEPMGTLFYLGNAQLDAGLTAEAQNTVLQILDSDEENEDAQLLLARVLNAQGEWQEALSICIQQVSSSGKSDFSFLASELLWRQREYERALDYLEAGIAQVPPNPAYYLQWANALHFLGRVGEAIEHLQEVLQRIPPHSKILHKLGDLYMVMGDNESAAEYYGRAAALSPDSAN